MMIMQKYESNNTDKYLQDCTVIIYIYIFVDRKREIEYKKKVRSMFNWHLMLLVHFVGRTTSITISFSPWESWLTYFSKKISYLIGIVMWKPSCVVLAIRKYRQVLLWTFTFLQEPQICTFHTKFFHGEPVTQILLSNSVLE